MNNLRPLFVAEAFPDEDSTDGLESLNPFEHSRSYRFEGFQGQSAPKSDIVPKGRIGATNNGRCLISIGEPLSFPLAGAAIASLDPRLQAQFTAFDFYVVQLACSFQTFASYPFREARFTIALHAESPTEQITGRSAAIAYDLYPLRLEDERQVSRHLALTPSLKFTAVGAEAALPLPTYETTETHARYTGRVEAFDLQGSNPSWTFQRTASRDISGPQKLFLLLRTGKGTRVLASFNLQASIEANGTLKQLQLKFRRADTSALAEIPSAYLC